MHQCKTKRHTWLHLADAEKCCNGWKRILVLNPTSRHASNIAYDVQACTSYGRAWMRDEKHA